MKLEGKIAGETVPPRGWSRVAMLVYLEAMYQLSPCDDRERFAKRW